MNDIEFDKLITDTLHREAMVRDLDRLIIRDVRRRARRAKLRSWVRAIAFSFGLPLLLLLYAMCAYKYIKEYGADPLYLSALLAPVVCLLYVARQAVHHFSPYDV